MAEANTMSASRSSVKFDFARSTVPQEFLVLGELA
jgi:hypothetical protein